MCYGKASADVAHFRCEDCGHTWDEHDGRLQFANGQPSLAAALLLIPSEELRIPFDEPEYCSGCGHSIELHDMLGGCVWHDSEGPCVCKGFGAPREQEPDRELN